ncbi:7-carboxy-7-deazaguanine synthase [Myxococcota bacterium]|nr:7-carboxy-7-deazaguanine synthase [Myxococcota bacterium]
MAYSVKELFYTLQGEGARSGRASVFCRFSGCNLWNGRPEDRSTAACWFCDTDFVGTDGAGGGRFPDAGALAAAIGAQWRRVAGEAPGRYVVFTGGEPLLQLDTALIDACHRDGFEVAVETNGTLPVPAGVDWVCVSPKPGATLVVTSGHELKLVHPQEVTPESVEHLDFAHRFLQPRDGDDAGANLAAAIAYCRTHPRWRLSLQVHKIAGIP